MMLVSKALSDQDALKAENERLREALQEIKELTGLLVKPVSLVSDMYRLAKAALFAVPSDSPADVKTAPQMDLTKPVPTKAGSASDTNTEGL